MSDRDCDRSGAPVTGDPGAPDGEPSVPAAAPRQPRDGTLAAVLREWDPIYFALVMATGIVSIAAWLLGARRVGAALFGINLLAYVVVSGLTLARVARDPRGALRDVASHERAVGSFTAVAGTCVLGSQFVVLGVSRAVAAGLFVVGAGLWLVLGYAVFVGLTIGDTVAPIEESIDGSWLLAVVAAQSVAVLAGLLAPAYPGHSRALLLAALALFSVGGMLYVVLITLLFYRMTFFPFDPRAATPPYWINAGALAITTLAGARLAATADRWTFLGTVEPFLLGFTVVSWAAATWWIPLLLALGVWRHAVGGIALPHTPAGYDPRYWGMVFPLGMYAASTDRLAAVAGLELVAPVPQLVFLVAALAWTAVAVGLLRRSRSRLARALG